MDELDDDAWLLTPLDAAASAPPAEGSEGAALGAASGEDGSAVASSPGAGSAGKLERRMRNTEASRRHRDRKRKEASAMRQRNAELEAKREVYQARIAALQMEVEALRFGGTVDLAKENELLRAEIKRHKTFIGRIAKVADEGEWPEPMSEEERLGLLRGAANSGKRAMLGLLYASACDPTWTPCPITEIAGQALAIKFQFLPIQAPRDEATRIGLRFDYLDLPYPSHVVERAIEQINSETAARARFEEHQQQVNQRMTRTRVEMEDIFPASLKALARKMGDGEHIEVMRVIEHDLEDESARRNEAIVMNARGTIPDVQFRALFPPDSPHVAAAPSGMACSAYVTCSINSESVMQKAGLAPPPRQASDRVRAPFVNGFLVVSSADSPGSKSHVAVVVTTPLRQDAFIAVQRADYRFDENGYPGEQSLALWEEYVPIFLGLLEATAAQVQGTASTASRPE